MLWRLKKVKYVKCLEQCLARCKYRIKLSTIVNFFTLITTLHIHSIEEETTHREAKYVSKILNSVSVLSKRTFCDVEMFYSLCCPIY